jgi:hypothetical protein
MLLHLFISGFIISFMKTVFHIPLCSQPPASFLPSSTTEDTYLLPSSTTPAHINAQGTNS